MLRIPKHPKNEVVAPKEEEKEEDELCNIFFKYVSWTLHKNHTKK